MPGVTASAIRGLQRLEANGKFTVTKQMLHEVETYGEECSPVGSFIDEMLVVGSGLSVKISDLQLSYNTWVDAHRRENEWTTLTRRLKVVLPNVLYDKYKKTYTGVGLKQRPNKEDVLHSSMKSIWKDEDGQYAVGISECGKSTKITSFPDLETAKSFI